MRLMKQVQARDYVNRHLRHVYPYLTPLKIWNASQNLLERSRRAMSPRSIPPFIKIEPTILCQLRCTGCKQSRDAFGRRKRGEGQMSLEQFRTVLSPVSSRLMGISLSFNGEPLMHGDLPALIAEAHRQRVAVTFPTNLSLKLDDADIERLVSSGVDAVYVSLDGASAGTYSRYRAGGNFDLVLANVRALADARRRLGRRRPRLVWKFVVFDHNRHEVEQVARTYAQLGFDAYELVPDRRSRAARDARRTYRRRMVESGRGCYWLWHSMVIQWDGEVVPCCGVPDSFSLGNAITEGTLSVWRSSAYRELRAGFAGRGAEDLAAVCRACIGRAVAPDESGPLQRTSTA